MPLYSVKLPNRAEIHVSGDDRRVFLQGLITQDIELLKTQSLIYSCLLTSNGKFLFDFFIREINDIFVIDCEGGDRASALLKKLMHFKLRSKVALELVDDANVWQLWGGNYDGDFRDPRFDGWRVYGDNDGDKVNFHVWDEHRIQSEVPDGSSDLIPEKSFLHESDIITKTAVSYTKGCYMGQELVSRMHHRGLVKKQLKCVDLRKPLENAELRSSCGDIGLALVKV